MSSSFDDPPGMLPEEQLLLAAARDASVRAGAENVFLKRLLKSLPYPVSYIDADLVYRQCNAAAAMTVGRTPNEILGQSVAAVVGADSEVIDLLRRVLTSGEPHSGMVEFTAAGSSSAAFYRASYLPDIDAEGTVIGVLTNVVDVTDLVRGERALRESEERSAFLLQLTDALRPLADPVAVQETASRLLGEYLAADRAGYFDIDGDDCVIERDWAPSVPHLFGRFPVAAFGEGLMSAYQSGRMVVMNDIAEEPLTPEEREAYAGMGVAAQISIPLIKDGEFAGGMTVHSSAPRAWTPQEMRLLEETAERTWAALERAKSESELRRAEQSLRESEQHLRLATSAAGIGVFDWDIRTGVNRWSEELETMYGLAPGEFGRTQPAWEQLVHSDDRAASVALVNEALETGLPVEGEWRVVWRDGSVHWIFGRFQAYKDDAGRPLRLTGANINVTSRRAAEEALREHEAEKVAHEERIRIASDLHDSVTQSLFAATLKAEALTEAGDPAQLESLGEAVCRLNRGALAQMRTLLLELRGDPVEEVPLHQLLRNLIEAAESRASVAVTLTLNEGSPLPPKVHEAVYRITQEALNNVARHAKAQNAWVRLDADPSHVRLLIGDDGCGFDPDASVNPSHIGFRSMRERAGASGGRLTVASVQAEGTSVTAEWRFEGSAGVDA